MSDRYPGYDVLAKWNSPSWNEQTRRALFKRLNIDPDRHEFFDGPEWQTVRAICARIVPEAEFHVPPVPIAAMLDLKLEQNAGDGYRDARLPPLREAWRTGLKAIDAEAMARHQKSFHWLAPRAQDALLGDIQRGKCTHSAWNRMPPAVFFTKRILHDIVSLYYAHPCAWNDIGFGGPASPRGYVRMNFNRRDPWEASEARRGREALARRENTRVG